MRNVGGTPGEGIGSAVERLRFFFLPSKMCKYTLEPYQRHAQMLPIRRAAGATAKLLNGNGDYQ